MKRYLSLAPFLVLCAGCIGDLGGDSPVTPGTVVATFHLQADSLEALVSKECTAIHGTTGCTPYPNQLECDTLKIEVRADGKTRADCRDREGNVILQDIATVAEIPFICRANTSLTCQTCVDVFGNVVLDTCNARGSQLYRKVGGGWSSLPDGAAYLEEPTAPGNNGTTPSTGETQETPSTPAPATPAADACDYGNAIVLYAKELNKILAHEGLQIYWNPFAHGFPSPSAAQSFFNNSDKDLLLASASNMTCQQYVDSIKSKYKQCPNPGPNGTCFYCWGFAGIKTCRASRINVAALQASCGQIPASCDQVSWSGAIVMAYGTSNKDLFQNNKAAFMAGQAPASGIPELGGTSGGTTGGNTGGNTGGSTGGTTTLPAGWPTAPATTPPQGQLQFPFWLGSPLVLDLAGDGVHPTSAARGVRFDLVGAGPLQTAWVRGDDALLVLDRNGNGSVDDGTELFGNIAGGRPWEDGFQALAELDSNADGVVDGRDRAWTRLRLWRDADGSGTSDPSELTTLGAAGVRSLAYRPTMVPGAFDAHGNDLRLRSTFTRTGGGVGTIVDVEFVTRQPPSR